MEDASRGPHFQVRNLGWNVAGLILPPVAAFVSIPLLMQHLGTAGFGVFSLLGAVFLYLAVLDLGLGSAALYRVSGMLARGEERGAIAHLVVTAAATSLLVGVIVAALAYQAAGWAPLLLEGQSADLQREAVQALRLLALSTPILFAGNLFVGVLSGYSRFGQVNAVRIVAGVLGTLGPAVACYWWPNLLLACAILVAVRTGVAITHFLQCFHLLRADLGAGAWPPSRHALGALLAFGGWLTVSNVLGPFMVYMDRFYLAAVRPVEEVAHYVAPYELATRVALIPAGVLPVLLPILIARWVHREVQESRMVPQLAAAIGLACAVPAALLAVLGPEIMQAWTGSQVPPSSAAALQMLAGAVLVNCVAQVFFMQLQAMGQTRLLARVHFGELLIYGLLLWPLAQHWGVLGVALAWTVRAMVDAVLLCALAVATMPPDMRAACWQVLIVTLGFGIALSASTLLPSVEWRAAGPLAMLLLLVAYRRRVMGHLSGEKLASANMAATHP